jgi:hypothetical protein
MANHDELAHDASEPAMTVAHEMHVRRAESEVDGFVRHIMTCLTSDGALIDLAEHDARGTVIRMRIRQSTRTND